MSFPQDSRRTGRRRSLIAKATGASLAATLAAVPFAANAQGTGAEWTTPSGTVQGTRFSELAQITAANVGTLVEDFAVATGTKAGHQGQPLVVGKTMYVVTPYPNKLIAIDLEVPGRIKWTYTPPSSEYARGVACCDVVNRGAVHANGKIIYNVLDDATVAVDAITGKQAWRTVHGQVTTGETLTGAPIVANGKVIVGNAGGELGIRGWVLALDVNTGKQVWKAYSTGPDADVKIGPKFKPFYAKDRGTDLGSTSWGGTLWKQGGSTSWAWFTYDPELNLVYYGTGNPGVWNPDMRPGDNKWGSSIIARNADTGDAVWAYQVTPHDGWDYDSISESIVTTLDIGGAERKVLVHFDKNGFGYTLDAATGEVLVAEKFAHVTWATHVDRTTGLPAVVEAKKTHEGVMVNDICPSPLGGKDFEPAAYSPATKLFYIPGINFCQNYEALRAQYIAGTPFIGANIEFAPAPGGYTGELIAWDAVAGRRAWSVPEPLPLYAGALATAGNVVFYGTLDKWFKAVDATTGKVLFQKQLECGVLGNPISFTGADGKQRIAVYTGIGWLPGGFAGGNCPAGSNFEEEGGSRGSTTGPKSGFVHVFKLP